MASVDRGNEPLSEAWFLARGLPSVLGPRARWRGAFGRSAPVLAGWATLMLLSLLVMIASDDNDVDVDAPGVTPLQWLAVIVLFAIVPAVLAVTWAVARISSVAGRQIVAWVSVLAGLASDLDGDDIGHALRDMAVDVTTVLAIVACTGLGLGAIAAWAIRTTLTHFRSAFRLMLRALPVVLLTILVFFNAPVWTISTNLEGVRVWLLVAFLGAVATSYLTAGLHDAVSPLIRESGGRRPLTRAERVNVLLVAVSSQVIQAAAIAVAIGLLYLVMGIIVLNPANVSHLTNNGPTDTEWLGVTLPVAPTLLRVTVFLMVLTYMYVCARAVGDGEYRSSFLDPLLAELTVALDARERFHTGPAGATTAVRTSR